MSSAISPERPASPSSTRSSPALLAAGRQLTKRARLQGEGQKFTSKGAGRPLGASQPAVRGLLGEALPASIGHFRASACRCVNQKRGELAVEIRLAPQIGCSSSGLSGDSVKLTQQFSSE